MSELHEQYDGPEPEAEADEPYDSGNRRHVNKKAKVSKLRDNYDRMVLRQIMGSREGRAWIYRILYEVCHVFDTTIFDPNPRTMACYEGQRSIGMRLQNDIMVACPERYMEMMKEANDDS